MKTNIGGIAICIVGLLLVGMYAGYAMSDSEQPQMSLEARAETTATFGRFIMVPNSNTCYRLPYVAKRTYNIERFQCLVYDKYTQIMYIAEYTSDGMSLSPYYVINEEGKAEIGIYSEGGIY